MYKYACIHRFRKYLCVRVKAMVWICLCQDALPKVMDYTRKAVPAVYSAAIQVTKATSNVSVVCNISEIISQTHLPLPFKKLNVSSLVKWGTLSQQAGWPKPHC